MTRLIINGRFLEGGETAVNMVARELTRALVRRSGREVVLAVPPHLAERAGGLGCAVRVIGRRGGVLWDQGALPRLRGAGMIAGFFNTVPLWGRGYVTLLHDAHVFTTPGSYPPATRVWRQVLARRAGTEGNYLLTVSEHSRQELLRLGIGSPDRIGVVPNGPGPAAMARPDPAVFGRLGLRAGQPYVLALASLAPHKNIPLLLRALADPALADVALVLFGGAGAGEFHRAGHDIPPNLCCAGRVTDGELAALYSRALAVCLPSTQEGFGLPVLEGMYHGTPPIIAPRGALPEVAGGAGLIASDSDPAEWVRSIRRLLDEPTLRACLSVKGQARAAEFTWNRAAFQMWHHLDRWFPASAARAPRTPDPTAPDHPHNGLRSGPVADHPADATARG